MSDTVIIDNLANRDLLYNAIMNTLYSHIIVTIDNDKNVSAISETSNENVELETNQILVYVANVENGLQALQLISVTCNPSLKDEKYLIKL